jgi:hypothetical protein
MTSTFVEVEDLNLHKDPLNQSAYSQLILIHTKHTLAYIEREAIKDTSAK